MVAHKCAQNNDILGDICIASRTLEKCDDIIAGIHRKENLKQATGRLYSRQLDALDVAAVVDLIRESSSRIVINVGSPFINMSVLQACLQTGAAYMDTAIHEEPDRICEAPPWYANYEWKHRDECREKGITAILGVGFDPGVVNAYCRHAQKHYFDRIDSIDIMDVMPEITAAILRPTSMRKSISARFTEAYGPGLTGSGQWYRKTQL